jgi:hypothetical protein
LDKGVTEHIGPIGKNNTNIQKLERLDPDMNIFHNEYIITKGHSTATDDVWYWWDIMEVKLESLKTYGVRDPEYEKDRVEEMREREKEGLKMARRSRGELTEEERKRIEMKRARTGVVHELVRKDPDVMGIE